MEPARKADFALKLRLPTGCGKPRLRLNGQPALAEPGPDGYVALRRTWGLHDQVQLSVVLEPRLIRGDHQNQGKAALLYGPLVLAADEALLQAPLRSLSSLALRDFDLAYLNLTPAPAPDKVKSWPGAQVFRANGITRNTTESARAGTEVALRLLPFADAGGTGAGYRVWLPVGQSPPGGSLLRDGMETRSRPGNADGSINDDDPNSFVVTFNGKAAAKDWFAVELGEPVVVSRIVFAHGKTFHDGGWFDTSSGKPQIEAKATKDGAWEPMGELASYPATTATDNAKLPDGARFTCLLPAPRKVLALRVMGKPACGDNPQQAFSSCAELQAFETNSPP